MKLTEVYDRVEFIVAIKINNLWNRNRIYEFFNNRNTYENSKNSKHNLIDEYWSYTKYFNNGVLKKSLSKTVPFQVRTRTYRF